MPTYKNIADHPITYQPDGPGSDTTVQPGKTFTLTENLAHVIGTQIPKTMVQAVDVDALLAQADKAGSGVSDDERQELERLRAEKDELAKAQAEAQAKAEADEKAAAIKAAGKGAASDKPKA